MLHTGDLTGLIADPVPEKPMPDASDAQEKKSSDVGKAMQTQPLPRVGQEKRPRVKPRIVIASANTESQTPRRKPDRNDYTAAQTVSRPSMEKPAPNVPAVSFGDMPATESLRPAGHAKINLSVKWASRQADGLYLQSQYGTLRISPIGSAILRITFSRGQKLTDGVHPLIAVNRTDKNWKFRDTGKMIELTTGELTLQIDKLTGSGRYLDRTGGLLLAERRQECRQLDADRSWIFFDWQKKEQLYAMGPADQGGLKLRGGARIISTEGQLPFVLSDKGYAILPASSGTAISCDIPAYGSYLCMEGQEQQDYYFIAGKQQNILNAYAYLTGTL